MIRFKNLSYDLLKIADKVIQSKRINDIECEILYKKGPLSYLGMLSNYKKNLLVGKYTYFNKNFHVEPTNFCIYTCNFCSYSRLIKKSEEGWKLNIKDIINILHEKKNENATEIHITGGVHPHYNLDFYCDLFISIKKEKPNIYIKALTPVELLYIFKMAKVSFKKGLMILKNSGLDSLPGGGAEIFNSEIRNKIAKHKCNSENWLMMHKIAHSCEIPTNATMLYGHIESYKDRVHHMSLLRDLQDKSKGFQAFIPLKFRNKNNKMSHLNETSIIEDLRNYSISRIYLDNFLHIKSYWAMIGKFTSQLSLNYGVDDIDGTINDTTKIYSMAGGEQNPSMTVDAILKIIRSSNNIPVERDTKYNIIRKY